MPSPASPPPSADPQTRQRLLEAAGEVFAEQGFRSATVRDICSRAGANGAAVHYHFGDKAGLYREVLAHAFQAALELYPPDLGLGPSAKAEQKLFAFVHSFLLRILSEGVPAWLGKIMAREMIEPTEALEQIVAQTGRPLFDRLLAIVRELTGPGPSPECVVRCAHSVVGQCLFYRHCREMIRRGWPQADPVPERLESLAQHITTYSLAGIRAAVAAEHGARPRRKGRSA
jgi:AcrR family transcriptional regulator